MSEIKGGALRSPYDPSDWIFDNIAKCSDHACSDIPDELDLREYSLPSRNQKRRGTCAAFAAATIKEMQDSVEFGSSEYMSSEFIYYHRRNKPGSGMYGRNVFQILKDIGTVPESIYPYRGDEKAPTPDQELYEIAANNKIANYARVTTLAGLKRALYELGPCYLLLPIYKSRPEFWKAEEDERDQGGHAVVVVGYTKDSLILKNSWGKNWNGDGCILFPFSDWGIHWECWVSMDEKSENILIRSLSPREKKRKKKGISKVIQRVRLPIIRNLYKCSTKTVE